MGAVTIKSHLTVSAGVLMKPMYSNAVITIVENQLLPLIIFGTVLFAVRLGWWIGHRAHHKSQGVRTTSDDTLIGAILGLMGLLIAFSFSGAATRFDQRTHLIVAEANAVAAAYDSVSLLPTARQEGLQARYKDYLTQRLDLYTDMPDFQRYEAKRRMLDVALQTIDAETRQAFTQASGNEKALAIEAVHKTRAMKEAYLAQRQAMLFHQPRIVWLSLLLLVFIGAFLAGYKMGLSQRKERFLTIMFALLMACAIYLIIIIEFPMLGKISLDQYNQEFENTLNRIPR